MKTYIVITLMAGVVLVVSMAWWLLVVARGPLPTTPTTVLPAASPAAPAASLPPAPDVAPPAAPAPAATAPEAAPPVPDAVPATAEPAEPAAVPPAAAEPHSHGDAPKPSPETIEGIRQLRAPAPGEGEITVLPDGTQRLNLGNRYRSVPVATVGPDGKVHVDYHGERHVPETPPAEPASTPPPDNSNATDTETRAVGELIQ